METTSTLVQSFQKPRSEASKDVEPRHRGQMEGEIFEEYKTTVPFLQEESGVIGINGRFVLYENYLLSKGESRIKTSNSTDITDTVFSKA